MHASVTQQISTAIILTIASSGESAKQRKTANAEADIDFFIELFGEEGSDKEFESFAMTSDEKEGLGTSDNDN